MADQDHSGRGWWNDAVIYQVYPRSFADGDGDGTGDLSGVIDHLDHLVGLGVDAIWLSPFYPSPQHDSGYDVSDYCDVDGMYGTLADFDRLLDQAHGAGLRVIVDLVPNHTSSEHSWFQAALSDHGARSKYIFRPGRGFAGDEPPNNWQSMFGGSAWTRLGAGEDWYLHLFDQSQPDLDWTNAEVRAEFDDILRFWLDRGVDGFRVDVAHGLVKADGLPDGQSSANPMDPTPFFDQDGVHEIYRRWRSVVDEYPGDRILVAEAWVEPLDRLYRYLRPDEMHQAFNFTFLSAGCDARALDRAITATYAAAHEVGATSTWVLSNHDTVRHVSRYGLSVPPVHQHGIGPSDPQPDFERGRRRARAMAFVELGLPGSAYIYQGDELGLPDHTELTDRWRQDPVFARTHGADFGRDGARIPMPWDADAEHLGFGTRAANETWLPQPDVYAPLAVRGQETDPNSFLNLYRQLLGIRRGRGLGSGHFEWDELHDPEAGILAFKVTSGGRGESENYTRVLVNLGADPIEFSGITPTSILSVSHPEAWRGTTLEAEAAIWFV